MERQSTLGLVTSVDGDIINKIPPHGTQVELGAYVPLVLFLRHPARVEVAHDPSGILTALCLAWHDALLSRDLIRLVSAAGYDDPVYGTLKALCDYEQQCLRSTLEYYLRRLRFVQLDSRDVSDLVRIYGHSDTLFWWWQLPCANDDDLDEAMRRDATVIGIGHNLSSRFDIFGNWKFGAQQWQVGILSR